MKDLENFCEVKDKELKLSENAPLRAIVIRCLAENPEERPSMDEVVAMLKECMAENTMEPGSISSKV